MLTRVADVLSQGAVLSAEMEEHVQDLLLLREGWLCKAGGANRAAMPSRLQAMDLLTQELADLSRSLSALAPGLCDCPISIEPSLDKMTLRHLQNDLRGTGPDHAHKNGTFDVF